MACCSSYCCFIFLRVVLGSAAFVCALFAYGYMIQVGIAIDEAPAPTKHEDDTTLFLYEYEIEFAILGLPVFMILRFLGAWKVASHRSPNTARVLKFVQGMIAVSMVSYTMLFSATATAVEFGKEYLLATLSFVLGSIILMEAALLTTENFGLFELTLTVVVVQAIKTYSLKKPALFGIILFVYCLREALMFGMKYANEKVNNPQGESDLDMLIKSWGLTNDELRLNQHVDVDRDLPRFKGMQVILNRMKDKEDKIDKATRKKEEGRSV